MSKTREDAIREKALKKKKRCKRKLVAGFVFFMVTALVVGIALCLTVLFPIEKVSAKGSEIYTAKEIIRASGIDSKDNLFALSEKSVTEKIRRNLPYIETVSIKRELPDRIIIKVTDAKEYACYNIKGDYYVVNAGNFVMNKYNELPQNTFEIICPEDSISCEVGSEVVFEKEITRLAAEELVGLLGKSGLKVNRIDVSDPVNLSAKVEDRFAVVFGTSTDLDKKIAHLCGMCKSIGEGRSGRINLSMWTSDKTEGSFVEGEIE